MLGSASVDHINNNYVPPGTADSKPNRQLKTAITSNRQSVCIPSSASPCDGNRVKDQKINIDTSSLQQHQSLLSPLMVSPRSPMKNQQYITDTYLNNILQTPQNNKGTANSKDILHFRSHRQIAREIEQKEIQKENLRLMQRLLMRKSEIEPVEKHLQDNIRRQKILKMRMQLKNSKHFNNNGAKNSLALTNQQDEDSRQVQSLENIFKTFDFTTTLSLDKLKNRRQQSILSAKQSAEQSGDDLTMKFLQQIEPIHTKLSKFQSFANLQSNFKNACLDGNYKHFREWQVSSNTTKHANNKDINFMHNLNSASNEDQQQLLNIPNLSGTQHQKQQAQAQQLVTLSYNRDNSCLSDGSISNPHSQYPYPPRKASVNSFATDSAPKTVYLFFEKSIQNPKTGVITEYKFSYDCEAYYFQLQKLGVGEQLTLALPICHSTVKLIEEYSCDMDGLIKRLKIDKKTGQLFIKNFKRPAAGNQNNCHSADSLFESVPMTAAGTTLRQSRQGPAVPQTTSQRKIEESACTTFRKQMNYQASQSLAIAFGTEDKSRNNSGQDLAGAVSKSPSSNYLTSVTNQAKENAQSMGIFSHRRLKYGKQLDREMQKYIRSQRMRAAPQITPLAPLTLKPRYLHQQHHHLAQNTFKRTQTHGNLPPEIPAAITRSSEAARQLHDSQWQKFQGSDNEKAPETGTATTVKPILTPSKKQKSHHSIHSIVSFQNSHMFQRGGGGTTTISGSVEKPILNSTSSPPTSHQKPPKQQLFNSTAKKDQRNKLKGSMAAISSSAEKNMTLRSKNPTSSQQYKMTTVDKRHRQTGCFPEKQLDNNNMTHQSHVLLLEQQEQFINQEPISNENLIKIEQQVSTEPLKSSDTVQSQLQSSATLKKRHKVSSYSKAPHMQQ